MFLFLHISIENSLDKHNDLFIFPPIIQMSTFYAFRSGSYA